LFGIPIPYATVAQGVVWVPENAEIRTQTDGFVERLAARPDQSVVPTQALIELENPLLGSRVTVREAQLQEMQERYQTAKLVDRVQAEIILEQIRHIESTLELYRTIKAGLTVASDRSGRLVVPRSTDLPGRYVKKGDLLGYVIDDRDVVVRVVVTQDDVDLVRQRTKSVSIRFVEDIQHEFPARIRREVPGGGQEIPSLALSTQGGGAIALNPAKTQKPEALYNIFQFDVEPTQPRAVAFAGSRVYVRFDHGSEPIAWRMLRAVKQTFLSHFHV
jgi:putative peptide zinc metalloprotease protein